MGCQSCAGSGHSRTAVVAISDGVYENFWLCQECLNNYLLNRNDMVEVFKEGWAKANDELIKIKRELAQLTASTTERSTE